MLSNKYPHVVFLKVDIHVCPVSVMLCIRSTWIFSLESVIPNKQPVADMAVSVFPLPVFSLRYIGGRKRRCCILECGIKANSNKNVFSLEKYLFFRQPQKPTPSQPHRPSCSSGTQCEWRHTREQTPQAWRRGSNVTQKTTQETVGTLTFQRDT